MSDSARRAPRPTVRQQVIELLDRRLSEPGQHVLEPCEQVYLRQFTRRHETSQYCHRLAAVIAS